MMQLITPEWHEAFSLERDEMYRLRYRIFKDRLGWAVHAENGLEVDGFDSLQPSYLLQRGRDGAVQGCVRLLPTTGPTMLGDVFPEFLPGGTLPGVGDIWESSRFAVDLPPSAAQMTGGVSMATYELFAGMIEFGLSRSLVDIVTVTDARVERILRRAGWPLRRIGGPRKIGDTTAIAGYLEISLQALWSVRRAGQIDRPVLWAPVLPSTYAAKIEAMVPGDGPPEWDGKGGAR